jgi:hypothetical protein
MDLGMQAQDPEWNARALMVPRHDKNIDAFVGYIFERIKSHIHKTGRDFTPEEKVSSVDNGIHISLKCRFKGPGIIGKKILPPPAAMDARAERIVKSKMSIRKKKDSYHSHITLLSHPLEHSFQLFILETYIRMQP